MNEEKKALRKAIRRDLGLYIRDKISEHVPKCFRKKKNTPEIIIPEFLKRNKEVVDNTESR